MTDGLVNRWIEMDAQRAPELGQKPLLSLWYGRRQQKGLKNLAF